MPKQFDKDFKLNAVLLVLEHGVKASKASADLGIGLSTLERWIREHKQLGTSAFPGKGHLRPEDEKLKKLERENEVLRRERDILKKSASHLLVTVTQKYDFMEEHIDLWSIEEMARTLGVSRSGYYGYCKKQPGKRQRENEALMHNI